MLIFILTLAAVGFHTLNNYRRRKKAWWKTSELSLRQLKKRKITSFVENRVNVRVHIRAHVLVHLRVHVSGHVRVHASVKLFMSVSVHCYVHFFILYYSGNWHVVIEPTTSVCMSLKILKILAIVIKSAHSCKKKIQRLANNCCWFNSNTLTAAVV